MQGIECSIMQTNRKRWIQLMECRYRQIRQYLWTNRKKNIYYTGLQKENKNSRAKLACTQDNIVIKNNHIYDKSVNGEVYNLVGKLKDQNSITSSQNNQNEQNMTNTASGLQKLLKNIYTYLTRGD